MSLRCLSWGMTGSAMVTQLPDRLPCALCGPQAVCEQVDVMLGAAASSSGRHSYHGSPRSSTS